MSSFTGWVRISGKLSPEQKIEFLMEMEECAKISNGHYIHKFEEYSETKWDNKLKEYRKTYPDDDSILWEINGDYYIFDGAPRNVVDEFKSFLEILKKYKLEGNGECEYMNDENMGTEVGNVTIKNNKVKLKECAYCGEDDYDEEEGDYDEED